MNKKEMNISQNTSDNANCIYLDEAIVSQNKERPTYWLPKLSITEKIGNTTYTVTGSYEGETSLIRKLERVLVQNFTEKMEGYNDNERKVC